MIETDPRGSSLFVVVGETVCMFVSVYVCICLCVCVLGIPFSSDFLLKLFFFYQAVCIFLESIFVPNVTLFTFFCSCLFSIFMTYSVTFSNRNIAGQH